MTKNKGAVAAGHPKTAETAKIILEGGGNAFDAAVAAFFTASFAEHSLCSLGGGGFLLAHTSDNKDLLYDFFAHTPLKKIPVEKVDFYPMQADFGGAIQEFHIGMGAMATPGGVKGIFQIHKDLGTMPIKELIKPAIHFARKGIEVNEIASFALNLLEVIFKAQKESRRVFASPNNKDQLLQKGEIYKNPDFADTLEFLAQNGEREFYEGEIAQKIIKDSQDKGGYLRKEDLKNYQVKIRPAIKINYRNTQFITNPPPSAGGTLIAVALKLLEDINFQQIPYGSASHLEVIASAMEQAGEIRFSKFEKNIRKKGIVEEILSEEYLENFKKILSKRLNKWGSTTHTSIIDKDGNIATMTNTNGEGNGYVIPGTGIMMNNMLGEEDLNPLGFHRWTPNQRISSMMAPSIIANDKFKIALGSAGSNRIRSAILETIINFLDFNKSIDVAVNGPRLHFEKGKLDIEPGFKQKEIRKLKNDFPNLNIWKEKNLFFGGVNAVVFNKEKSTFSGAGDIRRGGSFLSV